MPALTTTRAAISALGSAYRTRAATLPETGVEAAALAALYTTREMTDMASRLPGWDGAYRAWIGDCLVRIVRPMVLAALPGETRLAPVIAAVRAGTPLSLTQRTDALDLGMALAQAVIAPPNAALRVSAGELLRACVVFSAVYVDQRMPSRMVRWWCESLATDPAAEASWQQARLVAWCSAVPPEPLP